MGDVADGLHVSGVTSAMEARLDDAGLIAPQGAGMAVRTGVMFGPGSTALITGTATTSPMTVTVAAHHPVTTRQASEGVYRGAQEVAATVNIAAAPAADSRIDVVWAKQNDSTPGVLTPDGSTAWQIGVTQGTAGPTPAKPAIPVGALELGTVTVAAGATTTNGAGVTIANTARQTVARGARIPVRNVTERNALTPYPGLEVYRLDTGNVETYPHTGTTWQVHVPGGLEPELIAEQTNAGALATAGSGAGDVLVASLAVPAHTPGTLLCRMMGAWHAGANSALFAELQYPAGTRVPGSRLRSRNNSVANVPIGIVPEGRIESNGAARTLGLYLSVDSAGAPATFTHGAFQVWRVR